MTEIVVTTQAELDAALNDPAITYADHEIMIQSPIGLWIVVKDSKGKDVRAWGSATVRAWDNATVEAGDNATVEAWGSATVRAWDNATVRAGGSATVRAGGSATVRAGGNATVEAWDNATVEAGDNATVRAWDNATVRAGGSATVRAGGSATVRAWDNATVRAGDNATVEAGIYVPVHVYDTGVILRGGIPIRPESVKTITPESWCAAQLVTVDADGMAHLYKAVNSDGKSDWGGIYIVGETTDDTRNWRDDRECGHGLHASPTPFLAQQYFEEATRFFEVTCPVEDLRPIGNTKCKAPRLHVLREVDINGNPLDATEQQERGGDQ